MTWEFPGSNAGGSRTHQMMMIEPVQVPCDGNGPVPSFKVQVGLAV